MEFHIQNLDGINNFNTNFVDTSTNLFITRMSRITGTNGCKQVQEDLLSNVITSK